MLLIGTLVVVLVSQEGSALRMDRDNPTQKNAEWNMTLGEYLLKNMAGDPNGDDETGKDYKKILKNDISIRTFVNGIGKIPVIVVETRQPDPYYYSGAPDTETINSGAGQAWEGWQTKNCLMRKELEKLVAENPQQHAVLTDGADVTFGGCGEHHLLEAYRKTVMASDGAPIVLGAELGLYPGVDHPGWHGLDVAKRYDDLEPRRRNVLREMGLAEDLYAKHASCTNTGIGPCSDPPRLKYANGGFRMGRVQDLLNLHTVLCNDRGDEQMKLTNLMFDLPGNITLDYTGSLVMNLHNFHEGAFQFLHKETNGFVSNDVLGHAQCFVHGNGDGKDPFEQLVK